MDSRFGRACRLWSRPTHGLRSHSIEWPAPPFRQFGLGWLKSGTPVRRKQRHWRWWKNLVGLLVYPHREIFPVRLFWKEKPQEACCDQLTSYAAVRNGHHNNFRFIISFWHVDSPSVVIRWGSAGSHRSPSTHAPRTSQITLVSLHLSTSVELGTRVSQSVEAAVMWIGTARIGRINEEKFLGSTFYSSCKRTWRGSRGFIKSIYEKDTEAKKKCLYFNQ